LIFFWGWYQYLTMFRYVFAFKVDILHDILTGYNLSIVLKLQVIYYFSKRTLNRTSQAPYFARYRDRAFPGFALEGCF